MSETIRKLKVSEVKGKKLEILKQQNWECAICGLNMATNTSNACLDHCHTTGFIRGVLCRNCNRGEGKVKTQMIMCKRGGQPINWLMNLLNYIIKHKVPNTNLMYPSHKTAEDKRLRTNMLAKKRRDAIKNG